MKKLSLHLSILIASIYAALFWGMMYFLKTTYPQHVKRFSIEQMNALQLWQAWPPQVMGMIAIILFGVLVYKTDWKKGLN